jgi:hypothetical protein
VPRSSVAKRIYLQSSNSKKVLYLLCLGLKDDDSVSLFDIELEPWNTLKKREFKCMFVAGFNEARNNSQIALGLVEIMMFKSNYPCFSGFRYGHGVAIKRFERRLMLHTRDDRVEKKAVGLVT